MSRSYFNELPLPANRTGWTWTIASQPLPDVRPDGIAWPRISIVTPSYNQAEYIEETIRSVLLQGYPNLEYIVVDGGSSDGTVEVIRKYERWLTSWVSEPDQGQADAINKGFAKASGEIIAWLNSDDYYLPGVLRQVAARFSTDHSLGLVFGEIYRILGNQSQSIYKTGYSTTPDKMLDEMQIPFQPACFFRKQSLDQAGVLDVSLNYVMDVDIVLKVMANAGVDHIPIPLATFRIHPTSKTSAADDKFAEELLIVLEKILANRTCYPGLMRVSEGKLRCGFYRLISKHFYMGNRFKESMRYVILAMRAHPHSSFAIIYDEGIRLAIRRFMPAREYRSLSLFYRSRS